MGVDPSREVSKPLDKCKHPWGTLMPSALLILGASVRAAAHSAIRSGYRPIAVDMFGDTDLAACCVTYRVDDYPHGLETVAGPLPRCPVMYTGALENQPALVDRIAASRKLYGNPGHVLRRIRDPFMVAQALEEEGLCYPQLASRLPHTNNGLWLRKPLESSGGGRISVVQVADGDAPADECYDGGSRFYFQRFINGEPCSAVYIAAGGRSVFLGATRQLVGTAWTGATGFQYSGSLGPLDLPTDIATDFRRIGNCLAERFGLIGIFGVDAILAENQVWPVEVNPRYTASVEILERVTDLNTIAIHVQACRNGDMPAPSTRQDNRYSGKAIIYADKNVAITKRFVRFAERLNGRAGQPAVADIPPPQGQTSCSLDAPSPSRVREGRAEGPGRDGHGTLSEPLARLSHRESENRREPGTNIKAAPPRRVEAGAPILTVFADGDSLLSVRRRLESRVQRVRQMLYA